MWGEGARDDYTIPSWLQRFIYQTTYRARITNFGQEAYVSTQEVLVLFEQFQKGNIPDIVIFYDGSTTPPPPWPKAWRASASMSAIAAPNSAFSTSGPTTIR